MNTSRRFFNSPVIWGITVLFVPLAILIGRTVTFTGWFIPEAATATVLQSSAFVGDPSSDLTILTWNVLYGDEDGERSNNWMERKEAFAEIFRDHVNLDILCIQEALANQVRYFDNLLPFHNYVGVGRDDGRNAGEHCPIYYNYERFELLESETFWLSDTPDTPSQTWGNKLPRICTWARLRRLDSGQVLRVFNTHFPLVGHARIKAATLIAELIPEIDQSEAVIFAGDLNCGPKSKPRNILNSVGLRNTDVKHDSTYHIFGYGLLSLDAIMIGSRWLVQDGRVVRDKASSGYPSDHFGVYAKLRFILPRT